jgi:hypothetical protein
LQQRESLTPQQEDEIVEPDVGLRQYPVVEEDTTCSSKEQGTAVERLMAAAGEPDATAEDEIVESDVGLAVPVVEEDTTAADEGAAVERLIAAAGEPDATAEDKIVESDVGLYTYRW